MCGSAVARQLVAIAERNLASLALQTVHEVKLVTTEEERIALAEAGLLISRARQILLPLLLRKGAK
jgi:hypothetical protein